MGRADLNILIVEDDITLASAMESFVTRLGYSCKRASTAAQAAQKFNLEHFAAMVIDCMLPDKSGVALAEEFRNSGYSGPIVLTSGIYRDNSFQRDAIYKARADAFFAKPFEVEDVIKALLKNIHDSAVVELDSLFRLLQKAQISNQEIIESLNSMPAVHSFHLPLIYSTLCNSNLSGDLILKYEDAIEATISFRDGHITKVQYPDEKSYFGILLVENGFTTADEVNASLAAKDGKLIGQRMVDLSVVSPHAIEIVQREQSLIRVSKSVRESSVEVAFKTAGNSVANSSDVLLDKSEYTSFLADWITTKVSDEWLKNFYHRCLSYRVLQGPKYEELRRLVTHPLIAPLKNKLEAETIGNLESLLDGQSGNEGEVLRGLHFLFLTKHLILGDSAHLAANFTSHLSRLQKLDKSFLNQNHFEILGVTKQAKPSEIQKAYQVLVKVLHPDRVPATAPVELKDLTEKLFNQVSIAYKTLSSDEKRTHYLRTLQVGEAEEILAAESTFEAASRALQTGRFREARKLFEKCLKMKGHRSDTPLYLCWALLQEKRSLTGDDVSKLLSKASSYISKIPHEDRHSPQYFYTRGLYYLIKPDLYKAEACFRNAVALDSMFIDAQRELKALKSRLERTKTTFSMELSQVVTKFFKKSAG